jgi:hypothetical protein
MRNIKVEKFLIFSRGVIKKLWKVKEIKRKITKLRKALNCNKKKSNGIKKLKYQKENEVPLKFKVKHLKKKISWAQKLKLKIKNKLLIFLKNSKLDKRNSYNRKNKKYLNKKSREKYRFKKNALFSLKLEYNTPIK